MSNIVLKKLDWLRIFSSEMIRIVPGNEENKTYEVKSSKANNEWYEVWFGDDCSLPWCTCHDWQKNLMPCKHMISIINNVEDITWESFSSLYKASPFFQLDMEVIGLPAAHALKDNSDSNETNENNDANDNFDELPKQVNGKRTKASACRELLQQIKSLTYLVSDNASLVELESQLCEALRDLKTKVVADSGLAVEEKNEQRRLSPKS